MDSGSLWDRLWTRCFVLHLRDAIQLFGGFDGLVVCGLYSDSHRCTATRISSSSSIRGTFPGPRPFRPRIRPFCNHHHGWQQRPLRPRASSPPMSRYVHPRRTPRSLPTLLLLSPDSLFLAGSFRSAGRYPQTLFLIPRRRSPGQRAAGARPCRSLTSPVRSPPARLLSYASEQHRRGPSPGHEPADHIFRRVERLGQVGQAVQLVRERDVPRDQGAGARPFPFPLRARAVLTRQRAAGRDGDAPVQRHRRVSLRRVPREPCASVSRCGRRATG